MKKVYFAGPLFCQGEKDFNLTIAKLLEKYGYSVFLPQRDGVEAAKLVGKTEDQLVKTVFDLDVKRLFDSDIIFMNLDGRVPDEGACVELGMAYALGKRCYAFKTDVRAMQSALDINPMIGGCLKKLFRNPDGAALAAEIERYLSENEL